MMIRMQAMVGFFDVMECSMNKSLSLSKGGVCRCHGVFDEEKFEFDEMCFELS